MFNSIHTKYPTLKTVSYITVLAVGILLAVFLLSKTITEFKSHSNSEQYPSRTISVSGHGEVIAVPDVAVFTFDVREESEKVEDAQSVATEKINLITELLDDSGIEEEDIKTVSYNVYPQYDWVPSTNCVNGFNCGGNQELRGYEVSQSTRVKVKDMSQAGELITKVGELGVSNISGLQFVIDEDKDLKEEARDLAIEDAKEKAENRAKSLGVKLGDLVSFYEDNQYGYGHDAIMESAVMSRDMGGAPVLSPGETEVTSDISIVFEIK